MNKVKIDKHIEFLVTKVRRRIHEKNFTCGSVNLKYMFEENRKSEKLIVILSACTRKGLKARYNYVRTLAGINENKLFILDDFAPDHRGGYYLGANMGYEIQDACIGLVRQKLNETGAQKLIFCGSSKGGWAALNFMTEFDGAVAIVGAPQYKLANYLMAPALETCRNYIMPNPSEENILQLNDYLRKKLCTAQTGRHKIFLHFSDHEHTYEEHIKFLIEDLKAYLYDVVLDCKHYTDHGNVSLYYPQFLLDSIEKI